MGLFTIKGVLVDRLIPLLAICCVLVIGALGCEEGEDSEGESGEVMTGGAGGDGESSTSGVTWHGDVAQVVAKNCAGCHAGGGVAPFALDTYESVKAMATVSLESIESGRMPPWMPDRDCRTYQDERGITELEVETFRQWVAGGMLEGVPESGNEEGLEPESVLSDLGEPDAFARYPEGYIPDGSRPDDYRCFALDVTFETDTFLQGTYIVPDVRPIVHHVLAYVILPEDVADLEAADAADEGPGYECFGGPGVGQSVEPLAGWAPGGLPQVTPQGVARFVPAGSRIVMQVHYNVLAGEPELDRTGIKLYYFDEPQPMLLRSKPQPFLGLDIPAGDSSSIHMKEFPVRRDPVTVVATAPHMHQLGKRIRVDLVRANGDEECLVDIPDWDFNWQQTYRFLPDEVIVANPGDKFRVTCEYDNSEMNQPVVNGERLTPRRVVWGDGSLDEMCLNFLSIIEPNVPPASRCAGLEPCRQDCSDPDSFECLNACMAPDPDCGQCVLQSAILTASGCLRQGCGQELSVISSCFRDCAVELVTGGDLVACLEESCPAEYASLSECATPVLRSGACDEGIAECTD